MITELVDIQAQVKSAPAALRPAPWSRAAGTIASHSRNFFGNRFVYAVISQRARGLSIGINLNPDKFCNFDCVYCEVDRRQRGRDSQVDLTVMSAELKGLLARAHQGKMRELPGYQALPEDLLRLKEVALSGDGEPTLCPNFIEVVQAVVHLRARAVFPFFRIVLITNAMGLRRPQVQSGLELFTAQDEIWAKLEVGTQSYMDKINRPKADAATGRNVTLCQVMDNILALARKRPVVIQSLFPLLDGAEPGAEEIEQYAQRLRELKEAGANISLVQIYSAHRPAVHPHCGHLPLKSLSEIAKRVREVSGLKAEVF